MARTDPYILAYAIASPRRWRRVYKRLLAIGTAIQYSVFVLDLSQAEVDAVMEEIGGMVDLETDDVRPYRLPGEIEWIGRSATPEDILLSGAVSIDRIRRGEAVFKNDVGVTHRKRKK